MASDFERGYNSTETIAWLRSPAASFLDGPADVTYTHWAGLVAGTSLTPAQAHALGRERFAQVLEAEKAFTAQGMGPGPNTDFQVQIIGDLVPRLPHPDASNQSLGPNLGGEDAIMDPPGGAPPASSPASGLGGVVLLAGGLALLAILIGRRK